MRGRRGLTESWKTRGRWREPTPWRTWWPATADQAAPTGRWIFRTMASTDISPWVRQLLKVCVFYFCFYDRDTPAAPASPMVSRGRPRISRDLRRGRWRPPSSWSAQGSTTSTGSGICPQARGPALHLQTWRNLSIEAAASTISLSQVSVHIQYTLINFRFSNINFTNELLLPSFIYVILTSVEILFTLLQDIWSQPKDQVSPDNYPAVCPSVRC